MTVAATAPPAAHIVKISLSMRSPTRMTGV
jgi:hypothetical protein